MRAYGRWQKPVQVPNGPVIAHIQSLLAGGMFQVDIAQATGLSRWTIQRLAADQPAGDWVHKDTADRILAVQLDPARVSVLGAARRLQALTRAGYRIRQDLMPLLKQVGAASDLGRLYKMRRAELPPIEREAHRAIADLYERLWDTTGPCQRTAVQAENRGWFPFEAWTDDTIDDPGAQPYSHPEATEYVDWYRVELAQLPKDHPKRFPFDQLTWAEQREVYRRAIEQKVPIRRFREIYATAKPDGTFRVVSVKVARRLVAVLGEVEPTRREKVPT
jgi:hypothetical protein